MAGVLCVCAFLSGTSHATTMRHLDTRTLTLDSREIVIGSVESVRSYWDPGHTRILTDVTFRIQRSLKGSASERMTLTQIGGEVEGARYQVPGAPQFHLGEESLLFVWRDRAGRRQVNGLGQGKFDIRRDRTTERATVQRAPGFAVRDARALSRVARGEHVSRIALEDMVREIQRVLEDGDR